MKKKVLLFVLLITFLLATVLVACGERDVPQQEAEPSEPTILYDREVAEEKYLKERVSDATAIYYKSSESGAFGDDRYLFERTLLPKEYTELDHIRSTGAQCIDTGVAYSATLTFDLKFSDYGTSPNQGGVFGTNGWTFSLTRIAPARLAWRTKQSVFYLNSFSPYKSYTVECGESFLKINGIETLSQNVDTSYGSQNVLLFKTNTGYGSFKLYYFKIYDGERLVRNYVPCYRNYDDAAGLYDLVDGKFYSNTTASDFATRETVVRDLPDDYLQVEYIEATGKQAITLPADLDCDWFELDCQYTTTEREMCIIGNRSVESTWELYTQPDIPAFYLWVRDFATTPTTGVATERSLVSYDYTNAVLAVNEQAFSSRRIPSMPRNIFQCGDGIYLSDAKLYGAKFKKDGALVLDLVPCVRKSDFEPGLLDLVNNEFYTNSRSGRFLIGSFVTSSLGSAVLDSEYEKQSFLTSTGGQYIDTGIVPTDDLLLKVSFGVDDIQNSDGYVLGNGQGGFEISLENGEWQVAFGSEKVSYPAFPAIKITICLSGKKLYAALDNDPFSLIAEFASSLQSTASLALFATNGAGGLTLSEGVRIYEFRAESAGALTELIPAERRKDGAQGMFDLVSGVFSKGDGGAFLSAQDILSDRLPNGYHLLEYVEGTGTQYIDTGVIATSNTTYEIDALTTTWTSDLGTVSGMGVTHSETYPGGSFNCFAASELGGSLTAKRTLFKQQGNRCYKDGELVAASGSGSGVDTQTMYLFGKNQNGQLVSAGNTKIYGCKIYDDYVLVRYYIPCCRDADGEIGLFDAVSGTFFQNAGTGSFRSDETEKAYKGIVLPSGYRQVEYIEGTGTQYILSDVIVNKGDKLIYETKMRFDSTANIWNGANFYLQYNYKCFYTKEILEFKIVYDGSLEKIYVGNDLLKVEDWSSLEEIPRRLCFFGLGTDEENIYVKNGAQPGRLYYAKLTKNDKVVLECVPCYRESDGKAGLYDLVSQTFLKNSGGGDFLTGEDVSNLPAAYERVDYIEYSGAQTINLPCELTASMAVDVILSDNGSGRRTYPVLNAGNAKLTVEGGAPKYVLGGAAAQGTPLAANAKATLRVAFAAPNVLTVNGEVYPVDTLSLGAFAGGITLFGRAENFDGNVKIYGIRVYGEKGLLYDYVPCCKKYDGAVGLFDQVNGVFVTSTDSPMACNVTFAKSKVNDVYDPIECVYSDVDHSFALPSDGSEKFIVDCKEGNGDRRIVTETLGAFSISRRIDGEVVFATPLTFYGLKVQKDEIVVADYAPVRRKSDRSIGFLDKVTGEFYVIYDNKNNFVTGSVVGHRFVENKVIVEASEKQEGDVAHVCGICGAEIHEHVEARAYRVSFALGKGVKEVKVYEGYDLGEYEIANVAYSRNKNTNNYSRNEGQVFFEIVFEDGYGSETLYVEGGTPYKYAGNVYCLSAIEKDTTVSILAEKIVANG